MAFKFKDGGGTVRTATSLKFMDIGGTLRTARTIKFKDASAIRTIAIFTTPMTVALDSSYLVASGPNTSVTSPALTATPSGGTPPYTYSWARTGTCTINGPTSASPTFTELGLARGEYRTSSVTVTASDSASQTATASGSVEISRYDSGGFA